MKNNTFSAVIITVITAIVIIAGVSVLSYSSKNTEGDKSADVYDWFYRISDTPMVYEKNTRVMYYCTGNGNYSGYMSPYYNEEGKFCRYIDGKIIPIE